MSNKSLIIKTNVRTDWDYDDIPAQAELEIDESTAQSIINLSKLIRDNGLHKLETFDYRTKWLNSNGEDESTDVDKLNVSANEFWFSAYIKHTNVEILTERQRIVDIADYFVVKRNESAESFGDNGNSDPALFISK